MVVETDGSTKARLSYKGSQEGQAMDYDYAKRIPLTCKECGQQWLCPWPCGAKVFWSQPTRCPECRHQEMETLQQHITLLKKYHQTQLQTIAQRIKSLTPHTAETMMGDRNHS